MVIKISEDLWLSNQLKIYFENWLNLHEEYVDLSMDHCKQKFCDEVVDFINGLYES